MGFAMNPTRTHGLASRLRVMLMIVAGVVVVPRFAVAGRSEEPAHPNIVVILADDKY